jgi:hypothetical protein
MLDGVLNRFPRNQVKLRRGNVVRHGNGLWTVKTAGPLTLLLGALGQVGQCGHESPTFDRHGQKATLPFNP